jgi:hypothetical protein
MPLKSKAAQQGAALKAEGLAPHLPWGGHLR